MKKLLIVTYFFPPHNTIASRRFIGLIDVLQRNGWHITVMTTAAGGSLAYENPELRVIRFGRYDGPTEISKKSNKLKVRNILKGVLGKIRLRSAYIDLAIFSWIIPGWRSGMFDSARIGKYDAVLASYGPGASLLVGNIISRRQAIPMIADVRDLGALKEASAASTNRLILWLDRLIEGKIMRSAAAITTVSETLRQILARKYDVPSYAIYNGWSAITPSDPVQISRIAYASRPCIYYAGLFYPHRIASVRLLIKAISGSKWVLQIRCLNLDMADEVKQYAKEVGSDDSVFILEPVSAAQATAEAQSATVNLVLEDLDTTYEWSRGTLTGKFLPLLVMEAPVLAIARADSEIGEILRTTNKGSLCSCEDEIIDFLEKASASSFKPNFEAINLYSKEEQGLRLASILDQQLSDREPPSSAV